MDLVVAYLKSALTNLNADIRWSAVAPLQLLLQYDLSLISPFKREIVPLVIRLMRVSKVSMDPKGRGGLGGSSNAQ